MARWRGGEVGAGGVGGEVAGVRVAGGRGTDDTPEFTTADAVGLGAVGGTFVAEGDGVAEALGGVHFGDGAGGFADGKSGGGALGVGDIGIRPRQWVAEAYDSWRVRRFWHAFQGANSLGIGTRGGRRYRFSTPGYILQSLLG